MRGQAELSLRFARLNEIRGIMTAMKSLSLVETKKLVLQKMHGPVEWRKWRTRRRGVEDAEPAVAVASTTVVGIASRPVSMRVRVFVCVWECALHAGVKTREQILEQLRQALVH